LKANQRINFVKTRSFGALGIGVLLVTGTIQAGEWTQWRGNHRDGKAESFQPPAVWPQSLSPQWTVPVGKGDTSPALSQGRLFTFGRKDTNEWVQCLDASNGKVLWSQEYPEPFVVQGPSAGHPGPRGSVAVAQGRVFTLGIAGILTCWNAESGSILWRKASVEDYGGVEFHSDTSMSPLLVDDLCVVHISGGEKGTLMAIAAADGQIRWKTPCEPSISSSPVVAEIGGRRQLVTLSAKELIGVDLAAGTVLWQLPFESNRGNCTTPVVDGTNIFLTGEQKGLIRAMVEKTGADYRVTTLWTNKPQVSRMTTPVLHDGALYGFSDRFFCADARSGEARWVVKGGPAAGYYGSVVDCGTVMLGQTLKGDLVFFKADTKAYEELARYKVSGTELWALPVVSEKRIYVRDAETVSLWNL
jgi:outer membrane protein assembly factor BamB